MKLIDYYDDFADNFFVPCKEITKELWEEMIALCMAKPYTYDEGYFLLFCPSKFGYEEDAWCVTSWLE